MVVGPVIPRLVNTSNEGGSLLANSAALFWRSVAARSMIHPSSAIPTQMLMNMSNPMSRLNSLYHSAALGFPWLATAYSEYFEFLEQRLAKELETKKHPAKRSADVIRAVAREKAALRRENKILRELHRYYEYLFLWLIDFKGEDLDDLIRQAHEPTIVDDDDGDVDPVIR